MYCEGSIARVRIVGAPAFVYLKDNQVLINPIGEADSGFHTFKIL
jgi:hypothetical protein